jgi:hypothetical protein
MSSKSALRREFTRNITMMRAGDKAKSKNNHPLVIRLFHAIIALKRLVRIRRSLMKTKEKSQRCAKSAFFNEIHKSHRAVKYASFGRTVVNVDADKVQQYRAEELERAVQDRIKKQERLEKMSRRRGGTNAALAASVQQMSADVSSGLARVEKGSVADRIRAMKTSFPVDIRNMDGIVKKSKMAGGIKETSTKDIAHILQKNVHISMNQMKKHETNRSTFYELYSLA